MQYFSYIAGTYSCHNKLQKAILAYLTDKERQVIDWSTVDDFKKKIVATIQALNAENPKCKPIYPSYSNHHGEKDFSLYLGASICNFRLYSTAK